jgi:hypothetical protein
VVTCLPVRSDFAEAIAAVDRPVTAGLEGDFGVFTTLGAYYREHLAGVSVAAVIPLGFPGLATFRAAFRLVGVAFGLEEFLVLDAEREIIAAIAAMKGLVLKGHGCPPLLKIQLEFGSSNTSRRLV